jgi:hypothetical protein
MGISILALLSSRDPHIGSRLRLLPGYHPETEIGDIKLLPYFKTEYLVIERESVSNTWMSYDILWMYTCSSLARVIKKYINSGKHKSILSASITQCHSTVVYKDHNVLIIILMWNLNMWSPKRIILMFGVLKNRQILINEHRSKLIYIPVSDSTY